MSEKKQHFVAVIGGAVAGSVAAEILADQGIRSLAKAVAGGAHSYIPAGASPHHMYVLRSEAEKAKSILGLDQDEDVIADDDGDQNAE